MAYIPSQGSVVSFEGGPWTTSVVGTVAVTQSGTWRPSISGTVFVDVVSSVLVNQGTSPWVVSGTVNQSVSGTVGASIIGTVPITQSGTMISSISGTPSISGTVLIGNTTINVSGSVVGFQGTTPWVTTGSVQGTLSVQESGTWITSIVSSTPSSVLVGASIFGQLPAGTAVLGSVAALQGTTPWIISSVYGNVSGSIAGTYTEQNVATSVTGVAMIFKSNVSSSVMSTVSPNTPLPTVGSVSGSVGIVGTPSISGTVNIGNNASVSGTIGASIFGQLPAGTAVLGSVAALQSTNPWIITGSVQGTISVQESGTWITSIVSSTPSSVLVGASIFGQLPGGTATLGSVVALQGTTPWIIGSVYGNISGSVASTITNTNLNVGGSVVGFQGGTWVPSAIGYLVRNDAVASFLGADLAYRTASGDSAGRTIFKPFAADDTARLDTVSSVVSTSVTALFNSVTGIRNYVTDVMIANTGSVATLVTFKDGSTSVLGFTIAPAGGGSNINGMAFPMRTAPGQDFVYQAATSSSVLYVTAKGYKAP